MINGYIELLIVPFERVIYFIYIFLIELIATVPMYIYVMGIIFLIDF